MEFHTDDYKIYSVIDLGTNFKRELGLMYSVSGYMEAASGMGSGIQILYMDYDHIIKLSDENVDYKELDGNNYSFNTTDSFYPGEYKDLNDKNLTYEETLNNGLSTKMMNFWYSATADNAPYESRKIYSSKISFKPTDETNSKNISDSRYEIAHFNIETNIYGYDAIQRKNGEELYYDSMSVQTFGYTGMRESLKYRVGKTLNLGDVIRVEDIYKEKVSNNIDFSNVSYKGYSIINGVIDFSKEIKLNKAFTFEEDIAIVYISVDDNFKQKTTIVELVQKTNPDYKIIDDNHDWQWSLEEDAYISTTIDKEGLSVELPTLTYSWDGVKNVRFKNAWYDDESCINPLHVGIFTNLNGVYSLSYLGYQKKEFIASSYDTYVCYELENIYGETSFVRFKYVSSEKETYKIESDNNEIISQGDVQYDDYGKIKDIKANESIYLTKDNISLMLSRKFNITISNQTFAMTPSSYTMYLLDENNHSTTILEEVLDGNINSLITDVEGYTNDYSWFILSIKYLYFGNEFTSNYIYGIGFSGEKTTNMLKYDSYFVNTLYTMNIPYIYSFEGNLITTSNIIVKHRIGGKTDNSFYANKTYTLNKGKYEFSLTFNEVGEYYVGFNFTLNSITYSFGQVIDVLSDKSDVTITYVTDEEHKFIDGLIERKITYNLSNTITTLGEKEFNENDILFGWTQNINRDATNKDVVKNGISNFIEKYNSQNVILYAIWDTGISVTAKSLGNEDRIKYYYRDASTGYYIIDLSAYKVYPPTGYVLAGWTGGFLSDDVKNGKIYLNEISKDEDYLTINAVYKKMVTIKYSINSLYSTTVIRNESLLEGTKLESNRIVVSKSDYAFVGWCVLGDETKTIIDLSTYKFTIDTTLLAMFIDSEGNMVC